MGRIEKAKARSISQVGYWDVREETHYFLSLSTLLTVIYDK